MKILVLTLCVAVVSSNYCWGRPKSDIVTLLNGDHITCEIKSLYAGIMECSTHAMGTVKIEWDEIAAIKSDYEFLLRFSDGSRRSGRLAPESKPGELTIVGETETFVANRLQVVEFRPLQTNVKDAADIYLSAGYDYTKASDTSQFTLALDVTYEEKRATSGVKLRHIISDTREESTTSTKLDLSRAFFNEHTRKFFRYGNSGYESNDQLELDYRLSLGAGLGRYFIDNQKRQLIAAIGLQANKERDTAGTEQENLEGALKMEFAWWRFDSPELDLSLSLNVYPGITESGRLRSDSELRLRWEMVKDLYLDFSAWGVYDNQNIGDDDLDYGVSTGIGWEY